MTAAAIIAAYPDQQLDITEDGNGLTAIDRETGQVLTQQQIATAIASYVPPSPPQWEAFAVWAMSDPALNAVFATASAAAPIVAAALPAALLQVQAGNTVNFAAAWEGICVAGGASTAQRQSWGDMALGFSLPAEFVAIVRG